MMGRMVYYDSNGNEIEPPKADPVPMTNADRIRAMTDEELAEMLYCIDHIVEDDWGDYDPHQLIMGHAFRDEEDILEWLKSPVEEVSE